jgi:hypothetical protein
VRIVIHDAGPETIHEPDLHHRPHFAAPRQVLPGQLVHESVLESMRANKYLPKARLLREGASWKPDILEEKMMIEEDPYASIRAVLRGIEKNESLTALQCDMLVRLWLSGRISDA